MNKEGIGIDIGGVLAENVSFSDVRERKHLETKQIIGAFDAVKTLREKKFGNSTYIISVCKDEYRDDSTKWLKINNFFEETGIDMDHLIYCNNASDKAIISGKLGLGHFVDNSINVLRHFKKNENLYLFQPDENDIQRRNKLLGHIAIVDYWVDIVDSIIYEQKAINY